LTIVETIILGIVQGLTEFLPVSSSGHLELAKALLGDTSIPQESMMMTVVLHLATALSTLVIFRHQVLQILTGLWQRENSEAFHFSAKILLSMIPAATIGLLFANELEQLFNRQITLVGMMLIVTGLLLLVADRSTQTEKSVSYPRAIIIGIAQAIAILPGISRSGATISTSVLLGVDRGAAASFSFLMVVPLILGKIASDVIDGALTLGDDQLTILAAGFAAAFITGLFACQWMIQIVRRAQLRYFSYYCFVVGALAIAHQQL